MRVVVNDAGYNVECAGQGEPLLLLHGFTGSAANWTSHAATFGEFSTVAVDFPGHGKSDAPDDAARYRMEPTVTDLAAILDELKIAQANVLGYSMGGRVALYFAYAYPERVKRLILESASPGLVSSPERTQRAASDAALAEEIERDGVEQFVEYWTNIPLFETQNSLPEPVRTQSKQQRLQNNAQGLANSLRGLSVGVQPSLWMHLAEIQTPTLLVTGELDANFTSIGQHMATTMPHARLEIVRGAGHTVHLEQPQVFDSLVLEFIKEH